MSHYDDDATVSHNSENRNSLLASSPFGVSDSIV